MHRTIRSSTGLSKGRQERRSRRFWPHRAGIFLAVVLGFAGAQASADRAPAPEASWRPVVIELFSSQNCGKCPKANANLAELAKRSDVIALTFAVGYWDYLGWSDTFAKPEFTRRQKDYNRAFGNNTYTPQMVYSGRRHSSGANLDAISEELGKRDTSAPPIKVNFHGDEVEIDGAYATPLDVRLVHFTPGLTSVTPGGGANRGKTMGYYDLVKSFEKIGEFSGGSSRRYKVACSDGCAVLVQQGEVGAVIAAAVRK